MYLSSKLRAFTLLECLVALLVIAGSVQVYQGLTTVLVSNVKQVRQQENQDWLLFVQQMEAELEGCQLVKVEGTNSMSSRIIKTWLLVFQVPLIFEKQMLMVEVINQCFSMSNLVR